MIPVIVRYSAQPGYEDELETLVRRHWPTLHGESLTTDRPAVALKVHGKTGVFLEFFEWKSEEAVRSAHDRPAVRELWEAMEAIGTVEPWDGVYLRPS